MLRQPQFLLRASFFHLSLNPVRAWLTSCHQLCTCFTSVISVHSVIGLPISEQKKNQLWNKFVPDESKSHFGKFKFPSATGSILQKPDPWLGLRFSPEQPHMQKLWVLLICFINLHMIAESIIIPVTCFTVFMSKKAKPAYLLEWMKQCTGVFAEVIKLNTADIL